MVVAGQVNAAVLFADTHSYDVMGVVPVVFVGEYHFVPLAGRPFAASYAHFSFQIIINRVLPTPVTHQGILLKGLSDKLLPGVLHNVAARTRFCFGYPVEGGFCSVVNSKGEKKNGKCRVQSGHNTVI